MCPDAHGASRTGQVSRTAADVYEEFFVPALFQEQTAVVLDAAGAGADSDVLDVACGTGVLARAAQHRTGERGSVTGVDRNPGMLDVARRLAPALDWQEGMAEALPFEDGSFDAVVSQFGLMFFEDRTAAIREMVRVLRPGGRLAVAVWASLNRTPGYAAMRNLLEKLFGADIAAALEAPYCLGDPARLRGLFDGTGIEDLVVEEKPGTARFPSIEAWVHTDVKGWTLADAIDDTQYGRLQAAARDGLSEFVQPDGSVSFAHPALLVSARRS